MVLHRDIRIKAGEDEYQADLADNIVSQSLGLYFRGEGKMLFVFGRDTRARIDMMFLDKPLYLYFLNSEKEVIDVQKAEPWGFDPRTWKLYYPGEPYRYLLESFEDIGLEEGDSLEFDHSE